MVLEIFTILETSTIYCINLCNSCQLNDMKFYFFKKELNKTHEKSPKVCGSNLQFITTKQSLGDKPLIMRYILVNLIKLRQSASA